jgi:hypothetical protein
LLVMYGTFPNRSYSNGSCRIVRYFSWVRYPMSMCVGVDRNSLSEFSEESLRNLHRKGHREKKQRGTQWLRTMVSVRSIHTHRLVSSHKQIMVNFLSTSLHFPTSEAELQNRTWSDVLHDFSRPVLRKQ